MKIKTIGEFGLIDRLAKLVPKGSRVVKGIGDDAAVLSGWKKGKYLLLTTDAIAEKVHFLRSAGARRIGRKALAVNLSDIAAMGGVPLWALINLGLPRGISVRFCEEMYAGMAELAGEFSTGIVGGDTFLSPGGIILAVAVAGEVEKEKCVFRHGARAGDVVCVTGELGAAPRGKHLDFTPRLKEARFLVNNFSPSAMIDLSDGLFGDLVKLCRASGVGAVIGEAALPLHRSLLRRKKPFPLRAASGGEEFELLFAITEKDLDRLLRDFQGSTGTRLTPIGRITGEADHFELIDREGHGRDFPSGGYDHFK